MGSTLESALLCSGATNDVLVMPGVVRDVLLGRIGLVERLSAEPHIMFRSSLLVFSEF